MKSHSKFRLKVSGITSRIILTLLLGIIFFPAHTYAAIYYVDYNSGLDSNPGTSKAAPWKRAPGMKGFTGSYTHAAGDKIIFKGGVTWPSAVLPITIKEGWDGTAANWDYHGIDSTWFSGTVFNRPKFDGQRLIGIIMSLSYTNNALIDGIEFTGSVTKDGTGESTISAYDPGAVTFNNLYIHNWDKNATTDNGGGGGIYISYLRHRGEVTVQNSILNNQDGRQNHPGYMVGGCLRGVDNVINCELAYAIQGLLHGGKTFAYNHVHHISSKFYDPAAHDNTAYLDSDPLYQTNGRYPSIQVYGNHFHDLNCSTGAVYINPKGNDYFYVYNNLFINVNDVANILVDTYMGTGEVYIWNNTFYISDQVDVVRGGISGGGRVATKKLVVQNNHIMSDKSGSGIDNTNVTTFIADHNLKQTMAVASAAGYTAAKNYSPVASSSPTVNAGTTIISAICNKITVDYNGVARAQGGIWDIGAYEFGGTIDSQAPTAPANLVSSNVVQTGFTLSWTASTDNTGVTGYEVFRGTTSCGTTAATTMSIAGLTCNTTYSMTVKARDASGNWSVASTAKSVTTSACTGDTCLLYTSRCV